MNQIQELIQEHQAIEREILELETVISEELINYPNLLRTCERLYKMWNTHETNEERVFPVLSKQGYVIPVTIMHFEHMALKPHIRKLKQTLQSGNDFEIKKALHINLKIIIAKIRAHIEKEDEILYRIIPHEKI